MRYIGGHSLPEDFKLPDRKLGSFALSLCAPEEQTFIHSCDLLMGGAEEKARRGFLDCAKRSPEFLDAWFMLGFIELTNEQIAKAKDAFLHILQKETPFHGSYILRFLPDIRIFVNLFEDFMFQIMPTTGDTAAVIARIYLIEKKPREAKKVIHSAFKTYYENSAVQAIWAESMLGDGSPEEVIEGVDRLNPYHKGATELDLLVTHLCGQAYFDKGDFRSGVAHWEANLHHAKGKNPRLIDRFRICIGNAYESRGFLLDAIEVFSDVEDTSMLCSPGYPVSLKKLDIVEKINTFKQQGISKCLRYTEQYKHPRNQPSQGFLEFGCKGEAPA
jgi:hypothetical protein